MPSSKASDSTIGFQLTFKDVKYELPSHQNKKEMAVLLNNISGYFKPGQLSALMGPSGSGKTTLLDVLAGRKTQGTISGNIRFAGYPPTYNFLRRYTGYVEQFDTLLEVLTVREMLMYTAELKRPMSETLASKQNAVTSVIEKLGLDECQHVKIGSSLNRGISGGQAKRVNIGIALVSTPRVLFLDEPTSGLDSRTANEVMTVVKNLTKDGTTVCATIHTPTPYIYELFDMVMMLMRGETVYFGARVHAQGYFESLSMDSHRLQETSEAEWITDIVADAAKQKSNRSLIEAYDASTLKQNVEKEIETVQEEHQGVSGEEYRQLSESRATVTPFWFGIRTFIKYRSMKNFRSPEFLMPRLAVRFIFVFLISTLFLGVGDNYAADNFTNVAGLLFLWCGLPVFSATAYLPGLILERAVFYRERADGLYRVITYLVGRILDEVLWVLISSVIFGTIVWFATDLQGDYSIFWAVYTGNTLSGLGIAYCIAAIAPNLDAANAMLPAYASTLVLFSGFMIRLDDIPKYYSWYTRINFVQYSLSALLKNQYDTDEGKNLMLQVPGENGTKMISMFEYYSIDDVNPSINTFIIFCHFFGYFIISYLIMEYKKFQKR